MKIGIDIRTLMDAQYSGVSEYTLNLVREILRLASASSAQWTESKQVEDEFRLFYNCFGDSRRIPEFKAKNVKIVKYDYPNKVLNYLFFKFFNYPKIDQELGVDVFFMPHINFIGMSVGAKSLITVHDLSFLRYPEFFSARKNFWHRLINVKKLLNKFSWIVAVSENTKRDIVELCGIDPLKVKVIYSGVGKEYRRITNYQLSMTNNQNGIIPPTPFIKGEENAEGKRPMEVKNKYNLPDKFILYLGTIEPRKNIDGIIAAYNALRVTRYELRDYKLVIAGGTGWKSKNIFVEWEKSKFKDDINFLGYIDNNDKVFLYNLASVFVYPSFYEGFGLPPLEAMASGLPVVLSFASSLSEVVGDAALTVDPYNANDIARALAEVLSDVNLRNKYIERGFKRAKRFSWEKTAEEYLRLFAPFNKGG